jgi:hypothetical protein
VIARTYCVSVFAGSTCVSHTIHIFIRTLKQISTSASYVDCCCSCCLDVRAVCRRSTDVIILHCEIVHMIRCNTQQNQQDNSKLLIVLQTCACAETVHLMCCENRLGDTPFYRYRSDRSYVDRTFYTQASTHPHMYILLHTLLVSVPVCAPPEIVLHCRLLPRPLTSSIYVEALQ